LASAINARDDDENQNNPPYATEVFKPQKPSSSSHYQSLLLAHYHDALSHLIGTAVVSLIDACSVVAAEVVTRYEPSGIKPILLFA
jgi:hypothetical protein